MPRTAGRERLLKDRSTQARPRPIDRRVQDPAHDCEPSVAGGVRHRSFLHDRHHWSTDTHRSPGSACRPTCAPQPTDAAPRSSGHDGRPRDSADAEPCRAPPQAATPPGLPISPDRRRGRGSCGGSGRRTPCAFGVLQRGGTAGQPEVPAQQVAFELPQHVLRCPRAQTHEGDVRLHQQPGAAAWLATRLDSAKASLT